jgi:hypothetical protein
MNAELLMLRAVFANALDTRITATNVTDNSGVRIRSSYSEQRLRQTKPDLVFAGEHCPIKLQGPNLSTWKAASSSVVISELGASVFATP